jgi:hypothetical protein
MSADVILRLLTTSVCCHFSFLAHIYIYIYEMLVL